MSANPYKRGTLNQRLSAEHLSHHAFTTHLLSREDQVEMIERRKNTKVAEPMITVGVLDLTAASQWRASGFNQNNCTPDSCPPHEPAAYCTQFFKVSPHFM